MTDTTRKSLSAPLAAVALSALIGLAACSSSSGTAAVGGSGPAVHTIPGSAATAVPTSSGAPSVTWTPATSMTCDEFPAADLQKALRTVVARANLQTIPGKSSPDGLECDYTFAAAGVDMATDDQGVANVGIAVTDLWPLSNRVAYDGLKNQTPQEQAKLFQAAKLDAQAGSGTSEQNVTTTYHDSAGIGAGSFVEDSVTVDDTGKANSFTNRLEVLRSAGPFKLVVTVSYVLPDGPLADTSVDGPMRSVDGRTKTNLAIAQAVLSDFA